MQRRVAPLSQTLPTSIRYKAASTWPRRPSWRRPPWRPRHKKGGLLFRLDKT